MPYIIKEYHAGNTIEIQKTYSARYGKKIPRSPNLHPTSEAVKKNNEKMAEMKLRLLLNANFHPGDLFIMLTYKQDPPSPAEAKKCLEKFMRNLRAQYKAENLECKYISVTEYKNTRILT